MITENTEEEQKKTISTGSNRPSGYSFGTALTNAEDRRLSRLACTHTNSGYLRSGGNRRSAEARGR